MYCAVKSLRSFLWVYKFASMMLCVSYSWLWSMLALLSVKVLYFIIPCVASAAAKLYLNSLASILHERLLKFIAVQLLGSETSCYGAMGKSSVRFLREPWLREFPYFWAKLIFAHSNQCCQGGYCLPVPALHRHSSYLSLCLRLNCLRSHIVVNFC